MSEDAFMHVVRLCELCGVVCVVGGDVQRWCDVSLGEMVVRGVKCVSGVEVTTGGSLDDGYDGKCLRLCGVAGVFNKSLQRSVGCDCVCLFFLVWCGM